jgi:hypothetical protein
MDLDLDERGPDLAERRALQEMRFRAGSRRGSQREQDDAERAE